MILDARKTVWVRENQYREIKGQAAMANMRLWDYIYTCYHLRVIARGKIDGKDQTSKRWEP